MLSGRFERFFCRRGLSGALWPVPAIWNSRAGAQEEGAAGTGLRRLPPVARAGPAARFGGSARCYGRFCGRSLCQSQGSYPGFEQAHCRVFPLADCFTKFFYPEVLPRPGPEGSRTTSIPVQHLMPQLRQLPRLRLSRCHAGAGRRRKGMLPAPGPGMLPGPAGLVFPEFAGFGMFRAIFAGVPQVCSCNFCKN